MIKLWSELRRRLPRARGTKPRPEPDGRPAIAVLPFTNESGGAESEYFSDGFSEEILNLLARLPSLKVATRSSSFIFKGIEPGITRLARELDVESVLEGSIQREGGRVRVNAYLVDASSESRLWSETYDRERQEVLSIQHDIASHVTEALRLKLSHKEQRDLGRMATANTEAHDRYLRGRSHMQAMTQREYEQAIAMYREAVGLDGKYAPAWAGIADAYSHMYRYADASPDNARMALEAADRAVELDPDSSSARASRGLAMFICGRFRAAERELEKAIGLNPNLFEPYFYSGIAFTSQGRYEKAAEMYRKAISVDRTDYLPVIYLAQAYASLGRKHEEMRARRASIELIERHIAMNPGDTRALCIGANQYGSAGEVEKGLRMAEKALARGGDEPLVLYNIACFFALRGDRARALDLLESAIGRGWGDKAWLETDSDLDSLRGDARFVSLLNRVEA